MSKRAKLFPLLPAIFLLCGELQAATLPTLNSTWKYFKGTKEASTPDTTAWRAVGFNDSATGWLTGAAPFRYTIGSGGTLLSDMTNTYSCIFMRQTFTLTAGDIAAIPQLMLNIDYNDGFIVWINGVQVANIHDPDVVAFNSLASELHTAGVPELIGLPNPSGYLVAGSNVIAIQAFNVSKGSNTRNFAPDDFLINAELQVSSGPVADTNFSSTRGFYSTPFNLSITSPTPGASVRYTTDGSKPSTTVGTLYTGPIPISTTTVIRALAYAPGMLPTNIDTHTYVFTGSVATQTRPLTPAYPTVWADNTVTVSSTASDYTIDSRIVNNTGGINPTYTLDQALTALPSLSITLDFNDLMSTATGIYQSATASGPQWERGCSFELIFPDGTTGFHYDCSTSMAGAASRQQNNNAKHSFRMHFKSDWGASKLNYPIMGTALGGASSFDTVELRATYNNSWTHSDSSQRARAQFAFVEFSRQTQQAMGQLSTHGAFYHLYVNGLYWGVFNAEEVPDNVFASTYLGGDDSDWDSVNAGTVKDGDGVTYNNMISTAGSFPATPGSAQNTQYQNLKQYCDIDNLIDYIIVNCYAGNTDWDSGHNWYGIHHRQVGSGYQFINWDTEHTLESLGTNVVNTNNPGGPTSIFQKLRFDPDFRIRFADHVHKNMFKSGCMTPNAAAARYAAIINQLDKPIVAESARWGHNRNSTPVTNKSLTSNVATLTTAAAHGFASGNSVSVLSVDSTFNGTFVITSVPTTTTFTYALTAANVNAQAATGFATLSAVTASSPYTRNNSWLTERTSLAGNPPASPPPGASYFAQRTSTVVNQFRTPPAGTGEDTNSLYPTFEPPDFSVESTSIPGGGLSLTLSNPAANPASGLVMYYTLDGSDPRVTDSVNGPGGAILPTAVNGGTGPVTLNLSTSTTVTARYLQGGATWSAAHQGTYIGSQNLNALKITEINYHTIPLAGQTEEKFEFIEFKNTGAQSLNLSGVTLNGKGTPATVLYTFPNATTLNAGAFYLLVFDQTQFRARYPLATYPAAVINGVYTKQLDNGGQLLTLRDSAGSTFLSCTYDDQSPWPVGADGNGFSLVPVAANINPDPSNPVNWRASSNQGGSPGTDDPPPPVFPTVVINEVVANSSAPLSDTIELYNAGGSAADVSNWYLTDDHTVPQKYKIPAGTVIPAGGFVTFNEAQFDTGAAAFALSSHGEEVYLYSANAAGALTGYSDGFSFDASANNVSFGRYQISTGEIQYPAQISTTFGAANSGPRVGPVVISEMMYFPAAGQDEFIELKNITNTPVNLFDPSNPANTWKISGATFTFPTNIVMPANGLILVTALDPATFRTKYNVPSTVQIFGPYTGNLQDGGESIAVQMPDVPYLDSNNALQVPYVTVDAVNYSPAAPWPTQAAGGGYTIERIDCTQYGNDPINWRAGQFAGTPGRAPVATWSGGADGHSWTAAGNWDNLPFASNYTVLNFPSVGAGSYTATNDLGATFALNALNLSASTANTLAGGTLDFQGTSPALAQTGAGAFLITNAINLGADTTASGSGTGSVTLSAVIGGPGALSKSSASTLILSAANTYSGTTTVAGGTLQVDGSLSAQSNGVAVNTNAVLRGIGTINRPVSVGGATGSIWPGNTVSLGAKGTLTALSADLSNGVLTVRATNSVAGATATADKLLLTAGAGASPSAVVLGGSSQLQLILDIKDGAYSNQYTPLLQTSGGALITAQFASVVCTNVAGQIVGGPGNPQPVSVVYLDGNTEVDPAVTPADTVALKLNASVTPVTLEKFEARREGAAVLLSWNAVSEFQNVGFNIYRRATDESEWTRANPTLLPGRITNADFKAYQYCDWTSPGLYEYKLESINIAGSAETFASLAGPVCVDSDATAAPDITNDGLVAAQSSALTTSISVPSFVAQPLGVQPSGCTVRTLEPGIGPRAVTAQPEGGTPNAAIPIAPAVSARWFGAVPSAASFNAVKATYDTPGVLLIPRASMPPGFDLDRISLQREGRAVTPLALTPDGLVVFGPGYQDDYTGKDAFFLRATHSPTAAGQAARTQGLFTSTVPANVATPSSATVDFHDVYFDFNTLRPYNYPPWFSSQYLSGGSIQTFSISTPHATAASATLTVTLWSLSQNDTVPADHALQVSVNGHDAGQAVWSGGNSMKQLVFQIAPGALNDGANSIALATPAIDGADLQIALLHTLSIDFTRQLDGASPLEILNAGATPQLYEVANLPGADAWVVDARFPDRAALVPYESQPRAGGTFALRFTANPGGTGSFLVVPAGQENTPLAVEKRAVKPLRAMPYLAVGPSQFGGGVQPLLAARNKEGLRGSFADQEQLFDYYNNGRYGPAGIQNAVRATRPQYLLLLGRTTYDYRNYSGLNVDPLCPAFLVSTTFWAQATSDSQFGDLGRGSPDIAVGRLPANNPAELSTAVTHILAYGGAPASGVRVHALADQADPETADFPAQMDTLAQAFPDWEWQRNYLGVTSATSADVSSRITAAANGGADWLLYSGHGNSVRLGKDAPRFLQTDDLAAWKGNVVFIQATCAGGWMAADIAGFRSIGLQALTQPQGGISAGIGTSTYMKSDCAMDFMNQLLKTANARGVRWGDALMKTQQWAFAKSDASGFYADLGSTEQLFGDPAMPVFARRPVPGNNAPPQNSIPAPVTSPGQF